MDCYTSDSSGSDSDASAERERRTIDYAHLMLNEKEVQMNLEEFVKQRVPSTIEIVILNNNRFAKVPMVVSQFSNLRILDLSGNRLTHLPIEITHLTQLQRLIAKNNQLNEDGLPKSLECWKILKDLNLSGNRFQTIPGQTFDLKSLKYLYLGGNQIQAIPKDVWKLKSLQVLNLGGNDISEVPATVGRLSHLQALTLSDNRIENLPASISHLKELKSLLLHRNRLRTLPLEIIALKHLTELSLRENPLVVRFVNYMTLEPSSLLEYAGRAIKQYGIKYENEDLPKHLISYLQSAHHCVNPNCKGVFFDNRVEHIKFVDFCGKYRIPLLQYLCSAKCVNDESSDRPVDAGRSGEYLGYANDKMMRKVLLG